MILLANWPSPRAVHVSVLQLFGMDTHKGERQSIFRMMDDDRHRSLHKQLRRIEMLLWYGLAIVLALLIELLRR